MSESDVAEQLSPDRLVDVRVADRVATVFLRNPAQRNALSLEMREQLIAAFYALHADSGCEVIVLTGEGGHFCAGGDLKSGASEPSVSLSRKKAALLQSLIRLVVSGPKLVIAAVEGGAFGAGFSLAAGSDILIAAEDARFCAPFVKVGLFPDAGLIWSLSQRIGAARARRIILTGEVIDGVSAAALGIVDETVAPGGALARARARASELVGLAPLSVAAIRGAMPSAASSFDSALAWEAQMQPLLAKSDDYAEGRLAFRERRPPLFTGR